MVNVSEGARRPWYLVMVAIALLLMTLGISGCGQLSPQRLEQASTTQDSLLAFVPRQSVLAAVVDITAASDWQRSPLSGVVAETVDSFLTSLAVDPTEDIRPWLGSTIALAVTDKDIDRDRRNGRQPGYLLVANASDGEGLREFLELFWQRQTVAGAQPVLTATSGVPIVAGVVAQGEHPMATAVVGDNTLLAANNVDVLQQSLRVAQTPTLQLSEADCCTPIWINLRIPEFIDWLGLATPDPLGLTSAFQWQQFRADILARSDRLTINTQLSGLGKVLPTESDIALASADPKQYLSASMAWAAMGHDLRPLWTKLRQELEHYQRLPSPLQQGQQWLTTSLAQSMAEPLNQLMANDYAVGQLADGTWLMAVAAPNSSAISQLDSIATQQGLTVNQLSLNGHAVVAWSRLKTSVSDDTRHRETTVETDVAALHTTINDCEIFSTSIGGLIAAMDAPEDALLATPRFQRTIQFLEQSNQGYIYGTLSEIDRLLVGNRWFSLVKPMVQAWSQSIDAIAITSYGQTAHQSTGAISILLKK